MEYQKTAEATVDLIGLKIADSTPNQLSKFRTKNWVEINDGYLYNTGSQTKFKTSMLSSSLCGYSDVYILGKGTITVEDTGTVSAPNNRNKNVMFKNGAPFTDCIGKINNKEKWIMLKTLIYWQYID